MYKIVFEKSISWYYESLRNNAFVKLIWSLTIGAMYSNTANIRSDIFSILFKVPFYRHFIELTLFSILIAVEWSLKVKLDKLQIKILEVNTTQYIIPNNVK